MDETKVQPAVAHHVHHLRRIHFIDDDFHNRISLAGFSNECRQAAIHHRTYKPDLDPAFQACVDLRQ